MWAVLVLGPMMLCYTEITMGVIYGLFDPRRPLWLWEVRYIGQTTKTAEQRLVEQIDVSRRQNRRPVEKWIRKLAEEDARPVVRVFEQPDTDDLDEREMTWIASGRLQGWRLLNVSDGGVGIRGYQHTEETKASISASLTGRKMPDRGDEWRRKISEAQTGKKQSPEHVEKRIAHQRGKERTPETRKKIGESNKGRIVSEETRKKISDSKTGVPNPKVSEALKGRPLSEEHRKNITKANQRDRSPEEIEQCRELGKQRPSDETKAKMAAARRAWWERKRSEEADS